MKIRNGFVSNSSSSSFIIDCPVVWHNGECQKFEEEDIREYVKDVCKKFRKNSIMNAKKYLQHYSDNVTIKDIENEKLYYKTVYSDENIDENVNVCKVIDAPFDLHEWYANKDLRPDYIVIYDNDDNFLNKDYISKKIIQKFDINNCRYNLHMG